MQVKITNKSSSPVEVPWPFLTTLAPSAFKLAELTPEHMDDPEADDFHNLMTGGQLRMEPVQGSRQDQPLTPGEAMRRAQIQHELMHVAVMINHLPVAEDAADERVYPLFVASPHREVDLIEVRLWTPAVVTEDPTNYKTLAVKIYNADGTVKSTVASRNTLTGDGGSLTAGDNEVTFNPAKVSNGEAVCLVTTKAGTGLALDLTVRVACMPYMDSIKMER